MGDLTDNISSQIHLFASDSSLFIHADGVEQTQDKLIKDMQTVTDWAHQLKMVFNPDVIKQAIEVIFQSRKRSLNKPNWSLMAYHSQKIIQTLGSGVGFIFPNTHEMP